MHHSLHYYLTTPNPELPCNQQSQRLSSVAGHLILHDELLQQQQKHCSSRCQSVYRTASRTTHATVRSIGHGP